MRRIALLLAVLAVAGCGGGDPGPETPASPGDRVSLALDFTPNPVHAPIYAAAERVPLEIRRPASGSDSLKLVAAGKVDLGVLDIHDLAIAREQGSDVVAVAALVGKPLAALVAQPQIDRPRDLEGRRVGVSGLPSDAAFVRAVVAHDGGDPEKVEQVTIGFNAVSRLLARRVAAAPAFWNAEGVALRRRGLGVRIFKVEDFGAPAYPEVVLVTSPRTLARERDRLETVLQAIERGVEEVRDTEKWTRRMADEAQTTDRGLVRSQLDAVLPLFDADLRPDPRILAEWARFDARIGIVRRPPDVAAAFDFSLVE
jgi:NitT/TauT family transport system substrate-binding protein/putative hydroxymethylpyrimidine transport system substrate-binding protein